MRITSSRQSQFTGFTMVEMLVSMAVLVLILVLVAQMTNSAMLCTKLGNAHMDADDEARTVFDRMAKDFGGMPHRPDVDFIFSKQGPDTTGTPNPNDKMFFYSEAPAFVTASATLYPAAGQPDPKSSVALVGYCVNSGTDNSDDNGANTPPPYSLQRLGKVLTWDVSAPAGFGGLAFLTFSDNSSVTPIVSTTLAGNPFTSPATGTPPLYEGVDSSFDVFAPDVFRLEFCFQVKTLSNTGPGGTAYSNYPIAQFIDPATNKSSSSAQAPLNPSVGDRWYDTQNNRAFVCTGITPSVTWASNGLQDVKAIVVGIAVLDANSRKIVTASQLANAAEQLLDFPEPVAGSAGNPALMASLWQTAILQPGSAFANSAGMPQSAAAQIQVYQRYFDLNN